MYDYPVLSILMVIWVFGIVTFATVSVFTLAIEVDAALATCYAALLGLPAIVLGVYQWSMNQKKPEGGDEE